MTSFKFLSKILITIALLGSISYFSLAYIQQDSSVKKSEISKEEKLQKISYDKKLLLRFEELSKMLNPNREEYYLIGQLIVLDGSMDDSTAKENRAVYEIRKKGAKYYCKFGNTETLIAGGKSVVIDHLNKNIVVSKQDRPPHPQFFPETKELLKNLQRERYELSNSESQGVGYINLLNNYHISCKEYGISYKTDGLRPVKLFMRLTNFEDPESVKKEKLITLQIEENGNDSHWDEHVEKWNFARQIDGEWKPVSKYSQYKIFIL